MKFACDKCGRSYVADEKVRNRAFRMKCKQCGNVIVVKPASLPTPPPGAVPSITQLNIEAVELEASAADPFGTMAAELSDEMAGVPEGPPIAPPDPFQLPAPPAPSPPAPSPPVPRAAPTPRAPAPKLSEAEEVFADLSRQLGKTGERPLHVQGDDVLHAPPPEPPRPRAQPPEPPVPRRRWVAALVGLAAGGGGAALAVFLLANSDPVVRLSTPTSAATPAPAPAAAAVPSAPLQAAPAPTPAPTPPAAPTPAPAPAEPAATAPAPPPEAGPVSRPGRKPAEPAPQERPRREVRRAEPAPAPAPRPARPAPSPPAAPPRVAVASPPATAPVTSPPSAPDAEASPVRPGRPAPPPASSSTEEPLDEKQIEATIARFQPTFEQCVAQARRNEPQLMGESRRITVTMTVNPNGRALYPTLDDALLNTTELGACLKREAGRMAFPEFAGEPVRVRVPLVLR